MKTFNEFITSACTGTILNDSYSNYGCCKVCNKKWDNELCEECFSDEECLCDNCSWLNEDTHKCEHS